MWLLLLNWLDMQIPTMPLPRPAEPKTLSPPVHVLTSPPGHSGGRSSLKTTSKSLVLALGIPQDNPLCRNGWQGQGRGGGGAGRGGQEAPRASTLRLWFVYAAGQPT